MARRPAPPGADRRQQILDAALDVFANEGFEGATTKAIAARADVTHGLIYFYFPSKEDLFTAACEHQADAVLEQLDQAIAEDSDGDSEQALRSAITRLVQAVAAPRTLSLYRVISRTYMHPKPCGEAGDATRERMRAFGHRIVQGIQTYLESQIARGRIRPVDTGLMAQVLMTTIVHLVIRHSLDDEALERYSTDGLADAVASIFIHGLLPQPIPVG